MLNEVEYRGFTISPDCNLIYMGQYVVYTPAIKTIERCKEVIDGLIETMEDKGFTCPPKPTKVRKVKWLSLPVDCEKWDKEDAERKLAMYLAVLGRKYVTGVLIGDDCIPLSYRVVEE